MKSRLLLPALIGLSTCAGAPCPRMGIAPSSFAPIEFFTGHTEGTGKLKIVMSRSRSVHVEGVGRVQQDGSLMLVQRIDQDGKHPRTRRWHIGRTGKDSYSGELSDAVGAVDAVVDGDVLRLHFAAKGGLRIQQRLTLQADGRTVRNHLIMHKFGVRVATLDETIRKVD